MGHVGWHWDVGQHRRCGDLGRVGQHWDLGGAGCPVGRPAATHTLSPRCPHVPPPPQAVGISVEFVSHLTVAFAQSRRRSRVERAAEATITMGSKVGAPVGRGGSRGAAAAGAAA